jgi:hypothetical protein
MFSRRAEEQKSAANYRADKLPGNFYISDTL